MFNVRFVRDNILRLKKVEYVLSEGVILDYYVSALWWAAKEHKFAKEQICLLHRHSHAPRQHSWYCIRRQFCLFLVYYCIALLMSDGK